MTLNKQAAVPTIADISKILSEIFRPNYESVDALKFRVDHDKQRQLLDQLEYNRVLKKENDKYWLHLIGLVWVENEYAKQLISKMIILFASLQNFYKTNQRDAIKIVDLSKLANLDIEDVKECLSYMIDGSWCGGHSGNFYTIENPHVKPSESILNYESFQDVIDELKNWINNNLLSRRKRNQSYSQVLQSHKQVSKYRNSLFSMHEERLRPEWNEKLSPDFQKMMDEIYRALNAELQALPAMGLRTVIDMVCNDMLNEDVGGFIKKLQILQERGHLSASQKKTLLNALEVGHASAHRGHFPKYNDLMVLLDIVKHLLEGIYILHPASEKLRERTPKRMKKK